MKKRKKLVDMKGEGKASKPDRNDIINWAITIVSTIVTIISMILSVIRGYIVVLIISTIFEAALLYIWGKEVLLVEKIQRHNSYLTRRVKELENTIGEKTDEMVKKDKEWERKINSCEEIISLNIQNASKLNNEFYVKIPKTTDSSYHILEVISESGIDNPQITKAEAQRAISDYSKNLFELYKRYSTQLLQCATTIEETYIKAKWAYHEMSTSIKLFNKPFVQKSTDRSEIIVYTAFRDKRTYDQHEREVGRSPYTIDGNSDFVQCLTKECFILNNAKKSSDNYLNEHKDFDLYYNCTVVVPIRTKQPDGNYKIYGYLCCDCLTKDGNTVEVFDKVSARYLFTLAQLYASFLETIDSNWLDRVPKSGYPETYLEVIYDETRRRWR